MTSTTPFSPPGLNRRLALGGLGMAALSLRGPHVAAQARDLADHPMAGTWLTLANPPLPEDPQFVATSLFAVDGTVLLNFPSSQVGPQGPFLTASVLGIWEADTDRRAHFTAVQLMSAPDGTFLGTITIEGFPEASADGQTFIDDGSHATITMRDAAGTIVNQILPNGQPAGRPVTGVRMSVGVPGFLTTPGTATSTS